MLRTIAIVPAAGSGKRLGLKTNKLFIRLAGKPIISYTLKALNSSRLIDGIIIAAHKGTCDRFARLVKKEKIEKVIGIVKGGRTRHESVRNAFDAIGKFCDLVLIHDGARPLVSKSLIEMAINSARRYGSSTAGLAMSDTIRVVDKNMFAVKTLDRTRVYRIQTPQVFKYEILKRAIELNKDLNITDEVSLMEKAGLKTKVVAGSAGNIKITEKEDLKIGEALLCE